VRRFEREPALRPPRTAEPASTTPEPPTRYSPFGLGPPAAAPAPRGGNLACRSIAATMMGVATHVVPGIAEAYRQRSSRPVTTMPAATAKPLRSPPAYLVTCRGRDASLHGEIRQRPRTPCMLAPPPPTVAPARVPTVHSRECPYCKDREDFRPVRHRSPRTRSLPRGPMSAGSTPRAARAPGAPRAARAPARSLHRAPAAPARVRVGAVRGSARGGGGRGWARGLSAVRGRGAAPPRSGCGWGGGGGGEHRERVRCKLRGVEERVALRPPLQRLPPPVHARHSHRTRRPGAVQGGAAVGGAGATICERAPASPEVHVAARIGTMPDHSSVDACTESDGPRAHSSAEPIICQMSRE
jgi:hypothetical protein